MSQLQSEDHVQTYRIDGYIENRAHFPVEELAKHAGKWVAFNPDGSRILDSGENLVELQRRLARAGVDPETVVFEQVPTDDMILSGSELS
jgi:hypothetical protein